MFITSKAAYLWNGKTLQTVKEITPGFTRVFALKDSFILKAKNQNYITEINIIASENDSSQTTTSQNITYRLEKSPIQIPANAIPRQMFYNKNNNLVVVTKFDGVFEYVNEKTILQVPATSFGFNVDIYDGIQASDGYYYLSSFQDGLFILNESMQLLRQYREKDSTSMDTLFSAMEDNQGNIWLTGVPNIVKMVPPHRYSRFQVGNTSTTVTGITKRTCTTGECIVAVGNGVFQLNQSSALLASPKFERVMPSKKINVDYIEYQNHQFYSGRGGIYYRKLGNTHEPFQILIDVDLGRNLRIDPLTGTLFACSVNELFHISFVNSQMVYKRIEGVEGELHTVEIEPSGVIWVGTSLQALFRIENAQFNDKKTKITKFDKYDGLASGKVIPFKLTSSALNNNNSAIIFGTKNGLMDYQPARQPQLQILPTLPALFHSKDEPVNYLYHEQKESGQTSEITNERLWYQIGDSTGYIQQDQNHQWQRHEDLFKAFDDNKVIGLFTAPNNILWFALITGEVYRVNLTLTEKVPNIAQLNIRNVNDLQNNIDIDLGLTGFSSTATLPVLTQQSNSLRIHFALADNSSLNTTQYRHRLLGSHNTKWSHWSSENHTDFTQLAGGDYQYQLEAKDPWARVTKAEFSFSVSPPWYLSTVAIILYIIFALGLLVFSSWLTQRWRTKKLSQQNIILEQTVAQRTKEVSAKVSELKEQQALKDRFFSNVSHEFRTPLTLTIGPLETALSEYNEAMDNQVKSLTTTALNNANKMLALVGQVLDLNRLEVGKLPLRVSQYDIAELLRNLQQRFTPWAQQENQTISCENCEEPLLLYFDQDQIDKCIANLLSNAIKYSGKNCQITIKLVNSLNTITVQVIDNGQGISEQAQSKVFERFYQDKSSEKNTTPGTGIGLSLVKELIELHHGDVSLNTVEGVGCCFSLKLIKGKAHFNDEQFVEPISLASTQPIPISELIKTNNAQQEDQTTLLVIDDNAELRHFISLRLSANYRILQAEDGEQGFEMACNALPDLIISDVSMPKLTGYELTSKLKSTAATKSIPVILLTAKASKREIVEGFTSGADDYLSKPFDTSELIMRVNAQINSRKIIRETIVFEQKLANEKSDVESSIVKNSTNESNVKKIDFIENINKQVLAQLSDPEFSVETLATLLFMSRATLSRKSKDELGISPRVFIIQTRMQHASKLLQEGTLSVSEIAYAVGFESLSYFSKSFKKHTGKTPSEYVSQ
jgi:signal transduction histidine kinase/DNA-binding response OmpR family regulator